MELKDVILSTLAEIEELSTVSEPVENTEVLKIKEKPILAPKEEIIPQHPKSEIVQTVIETVHAVRDDEARMLEGIRERLLVLFEGFQSPNNKQIEAKVDLTLNFFEYLLATIDNRLETIKES
ncbi:CiaD-like domain-containing protein [Sulfuricurvum sp.]|uniref:CiaD-like domain-containing protein n=1 Tax=Sulfuricurvum sp. TaxID=2025608 RepID=UPI00286DCD21|nr:hypothetical protein [Sulfuricurvum sp.]